MHCLPFWKNNLQFSFPGFRNIHQWPYVLCSIVVSGILIHPSLTHQCDSIQFFKETGYALEGHVIESTSSHLDDCVWRCRANAECFSINVKKVLEKYGLREALRNVPAMHCTGFKLNPYVVIQSKCDSFKPREPGKSL